MRRKSEKNEKNNGFLGAFYGSTSKLKKSKWNGKCHKCGIYSHFARDCTRPHPTQGNIVVQQANLVQNEMLHFSKIKSSKWSWKCSRRKVKVWKLWNHEDGNMFPWTICRNNLITYEKSYDVWRAQLRWKGRIANIYGSHVEGECYGYYNMSYSRWSTHTTS
jgi:hypothetical protein